MTTGKLLDEKIDENEDELSEEHEEEISKSSSLPRNSGKKSPFRRFVDDFKVQRVSKRYKISNNLLQNLLVNRVGELLYLLEMRMTLFHSKVRSIERFF